MKNKKVQNKPIIVFEDLTRKIRYSDSNIITIFENLNFIINKGDQVGFYGVENSGLNDLLNILLCNYEPDNGTIKINDEDIMKLGVSQKRALINNKFGLISVELIVPTLTVRENIELILADFNLGNIDLQDRINKALSDLELTELKDKLVNDLDLTQRSLVILVAAMVKKPEVLIINKLSYGMHQSERNAFISKCSDLASKNNITLILFTDDIRMATKLKYTLRLEDGKLI